MSQPKEVEVPEGAILCRFGDVPVGTWEVRWMDGWRLGDAFLRTQLEDMDLVIARPKPTATVPLDRLRDVRDQARTSYVDARPGSNAEDIALTMVFALDDLIEGPVRPVPVKRVEAVAEQVHAMFMDARPLSRAYLVACEIADALDAIIGEAEAQS